jgi:hypothetical protein
MENFNMSKHTSFYAVGLSYKKADAEIRGKFSLDAKAKATLLMQAEAEGIEAVARLETPCCCQGRHCREAQASRRRHSAQSQHHGRAAKE